MLYAQQWRHSVHKSIYRLNVAPSLAQLPLVLYISLARIGRWATRSAERDIFLDTIYSNVSARRGITRHEKDKYRKISLDLLLPPAECISATQGNRPEFFVPGFWAFINHRSKGARWLTMSRWFSARICCLSLSCAINHGSWVLYNSLNEAAVFAIKIQASSIFLPFVHETKISCSNDPAFIAACRILDSKNWSAFNMVD